MQLTPDTLHTFVTVTRTGNITRAAKLVNLTQSAVSMQINRLEEDLGKKLFRRIPRGVELTHDGAILLEYARSILRLHEEALADLTRPVLSDRLRLGAAEDYANLHLPGILRRFGYKYPQVRVDVYCDLSDNLLKMLQNRELDLCLCNSEHGEKGGSFLRSEPMIWIAPMDKELEKKSPLPLAVYHQGCMFRKWVEQTLVRHDIPYRIAYSSHSTIGVIAAVKAGLAVAPVGASTRLSGIRVLLSEELPILPSSVINLHQSNKPGSKAQTYLAKYITEEFKALSSKLPNTQF